MKRIIILLMAAALLTAGCVKSMPDEDEYAAGGGVTNSGKDAPKTIESKDIVYFACEFAWYEEEMYCLFSLQKTDGGVEYHATVRERQTVSPAERTVSADCLVDGSVLVSLQELLDRYDTSRLNGHIDVDAGTPPDGGCYLEVGYASGERILVNDGTSVVFKTSERQALYDFFVALAADNGCDIDLVFGGEAPAPEGEAQP